MNELSIWLSVKSKSHCDWRSVSQYVLVSSPIWGTWPDIVITVWQLRSCFCGAPSLTRGRVCLLHMLLAIASVVFLGSESLGTRNHILLSQIWDFPFRRLLRLAGSRWRHSTPPPHGFDSVFSRVLLLRLLDEPNRDYHLKIFSLPVATKRVLIL
jgi:hypothetical protein